MASRYGYAMPIWYRSCKENERQSRIPLTLHPSYGCSAGSVKGEVITSTDPEFRAV